MVFRRKASIVLLHSGVILLMVSELVTGLTAEEAMMTIFEGQTVRFAEDSREVELAILDSSDGAVDDVTAVPMSLLKLGGVIDLPGLPFNVEVSRFLKNGQLQRPRPEEANPATRGIGLQAVAHEVSESSGVSTKDGVDEPAAYVTFRDKGGGALGTWLVAARLSMEQGLQTVTVGGTSYGLSLRFKRIYKPYSLYLHDFRFERYVGTETPKDFSSFVRLEDPERGVARDVRIWMNNPLRYRGETLYQASWDRATEEGTVLQVMENRGWMVPYVACMIVAIGLLGQFLLHLLEFLRKRRAA
jgi:cytochrome c biogenesis protein ResB